MKTLLILSILIAVFTISSCLPTIKTDFYLPKNYTGEVAVIYNSKNADAPVYKKGALQLTIPDSGIVSTRARYQSGHIIYNYYIKNESGTYDKIPVHLFENPDGRRYIFFQRVLTITCGPHKREEGKENLAELFYVGEKSDSTSSKKRFFFERHIDSLICQYR